MRQHEKRLEFSCRGSAQKEKRSDWVASCGGRPAEKTKLKGKFSSGFRCRLSKKKFDPTFLA